MLDFYLIIFQIVSRVSWTIERLIWGVLNSPIFSWGYPVNLASWNSCELTALWKVFYLQSLLPSYTQPYCHYQWWGFLNSCIFFIPLLRSHGDLVSFSFSWWTFFVSLQSPMNFLRLLWIFRLRTPQVNLTIMTQLSIGRFRNRSNDHHLLRIYCFQNVIWNF